MSRDTLKQFLEGFGGRAVLLAVSLIGTVAISVGAWYAKRVGDNQDWHNERFNKFLVEQAKTDGLKITRDELDKRLADMRSDIERSNRQVTDSMQRMETNTRQLIELITYQRLPKTSSN